MYPNQRPQPPSPTGRVLQAVPMVHRPNVPSGYPSNQLPGNTPNHRLPTVPQYSFPRPGYVQAYPQQIIQQQPRLMASPNGSYVVPQRPEHTPGGQQPQQFWQQVVVSPYPPQQQLPTGETVIYHQAPGYVSNAPQFDPRFQGQNITGMNQNSQNPMLSMDPSSQNLNLVQQQQQQQTQLRPLFPGQLIQQQQQQQQPVRYTFSTGQTVVTSSPQQQQIQPQQHSNLNQSQFTQVRFQMPPHSVQQQQQQQQQQLTQSLNCIQMPQILRNDETCQITGNEAFTSGSVMFISQGSTATSSTTTTASSASGSGLIFTGNSASGEATGNPVFIQANSHQQIMPVMLPQNPQQIPLASTSVQKVGVPWPWNRRIVSDSVIYVRYSYHLNTGLMETRFI